MPCEYLQPQCDRAYRSGNDAGTIWAVLRWRRYQSEHSFRLSQAIARRVSEAGRLIVSAAAQLTRKRGPGVSPDFSAVNPTSRLSEIPGWHAPIPGRTSVVQARCAWRLAS